MSKFVTQLAAVPQPWPLLRLGTRQWFVKMLQRVLAERGFGDSAWADPERAVSDNFGPEVWQAVKDFQAAAALDVDGIVGPKTWAKLAGIPSQQVPQSQPIPSQHVKGDDLRLLGLNYAQFLVALGVREHGGQNRGEVVDAVNRHTLGHTGEPWCATVIDFCADTAAKVLRAPRPLDIGASTSQLHVRAKAAKRLVPLARVKPGHVFLVPGGPTGWKHTGMVLEVLAGGKVRTIEGNTNDEGSNEGYEMCIRTRDAKGLAFVDWSST